MDETDDIARLARALKREIALNRDFVSQEEIVLLSFVHTWQHMERLGKRFFPRFGLSDAQFNVLMILWDYRATGLRQHQLADILMVNRASAGGVIDRMEKQGWLERRRDPSDRRANYLHLTPAGVALLERVKPAYYALFPSAFAGLDAARQQTLIRLLAGFRAGIAQAGAALDDGAETGGQA